MVRSYVPYAGDIVWLSFDPQAGHEQAGHRPAVVLSPSAYNAKTSLMICCPMTTQIKNYPFEVRIAGIDKRKSKELKANPKRGIGFEEVQEIFSRPYYLDQRRDIPEQYRAIGWVGERLYSLIFEVREDKEREYYHLVTLWKATRQEQQLYEEHS